ncbi:hypothetical protein V2O64_23285 [Verrucomicrobiaceae bacterium 227]
MIRFLLMALVLISPGFANPDPAVLAMAEAPEGGVYDPLDWLEAGKRTELEENYRGAFEKWGVKIFVVVLPEKPESGAEVFAKKVGRGWAGQETWGLLLHVVGDAQSPWCAAEGGESLRWAKQEEFDRALEQAMSRAHRESKADLSVMVGARELTDELVFLGVVSNRRDQTLGKGQELRERPVEADSKKDGFRLGSWWVVLPFALILGLIVVVLLRARSRARMRGFEFPETAPQRRFHGPWSGGGNVLEIFSGKSSGKGPRRG